MANGLSFIVDRGDRILLGGRANRQGGKLAVRSLLVDAKRQRIVICAPAWIRFLPGKRYEFAFDEIAAMRLDVIDREGQVSLGLVLTRHHEEPVVFGFDVEHLDRLDEARDLFSRLAAPLTFGSKASPYRRAESNWVGYTVESERSGQMTLRLSRERADDVHVIERPGHRADYEARVSDFEAEGEDVEREPVLALHRHVSSSSPGVAALVGGSAVLMFFSPMYCAQQTSPWLYLFGAALFVLVLKSLAESADTYAGTLYEVALMLRMAAGMGGWAAFFWLVGYVQTNTIGPVLASVVCGIWLVLMIIAALGGGFRPLQALRYGASYLRDAGVLAACVLAATSMH